MRNVGNNLAYIISFFTFSFIFGCNKPEIIPTIYAEKVFSASGPLHSIHFTDEMHGYAGGHNGILLVTSDGGVSWNQAALAPSENADFNCISFPSHDIGWASGKESFNISNSSEALYKTTNGGLTWINQSAMSGMNYSSFPTSNVGYQSDSYYMQKTSNGGQNWLNLFSTPSAGYGLYFINKDTGFACNSVSTYRTANGGNSWAITDMEESPYDIAFYDRSNGAAVLPHGIIQLTSDGGLHWRTVYTSGEDIWLNTIVWASANVIVAGGNNHLAVSVDGGENWKYYFQQDGTSFPGEISAICFYDNRHGYAVTEEGGIFRLRRDEEITD